MRPPSRVEQIMRAYTHHAATGFHHNYMGRWQSPCTSRIASPQLMQPARTLRYKMHRPLMIDRRTKNRQRRKSSMRKKHRTKRGEKETNSGSDATSPAPCGRVEATALGRD